MPKSRSRSRSRSNKKYRGGDGTVPATTTSTSDKGWFSGIMDSGTSMWSDMTKPKPKTPLSTPSYTTAPVSSSTTVMGGKRTRRRFRGGSLANTAATVSNIKMAKPTYMVSGGRTRRRKKRSKKYRKR